eukprot:3837179-Pyramimonas_sp.AAC.1
MSHAFDTSGGVATSKFDAEMAERRKTQAIIMKSERLLKEEHDADRKRQKENNQNKDKEGDGGAGASSSGG